jgi:large subunit ribosomal protein L24
MATKLKIKKGATVQVITGNDKGKKGAVLEIKPGELLVKVQGVKVQTHFDKKEGLLKKEGFIHYSNVKLVEKAPEKKAAGKKASKAKSA